MDFHHNVENTPNYHDLSLKAHSLSPTISSCSTSTRSLPSLITLHQSSITLSNNSHIDNSTIPRNNCDHDLITSGTTIHEDPQWGGPTTPAFTNRDHHKNRCHHTSDQHPSQGKQFKRCLSYCEQHNTDGGLTPSNPIQQHPPSYN